MHRFVGCIWVVDEPATREALLPATEAEQSGALIPVFLADARHRDRCGRTLLCSPRRRSPWRFKPGKTW